MQLVKSMNFIADSLPEIKLIPLESETPLNVQERRSARPTDIRWMKVLEFLRSNNLAPNSRKLYERELKRFLAWSELHYHELRPRHLALYKEYLRDELRTDVGKPLSKSSINAGIAALKSFFKWMCYTYPDIIATNPTLGIS